MQIVKNVPLPPGITLSGRRGRPEKYPFRYMRPGDSFLAPSDVNESAFRVAASCAGKRLADGIKFHVHKYDACEPGVAPALIGRLRVWRIA